MKFDMFAPNYGTLPSKYFEKSAITNPTELFWSDDLLSLMRLCGAREEQIGERASDYDRFLSICCALSLLHGHPTRAWIASVFEKYFHLKELPTEETAPIVWKNLCDTLLECPLSPKDIVSGDWLCESLTIPSALPQNITPTLNANLLLSTFAKSTAAWRDEIAATIAHFAANGCQKIVLHLPKEFSFVVPSVYHVDRTLQFAKRDRKATNLLICQLTRELCSILQENGILLVLVCENNAPSISNLLEYAENNVGLPRLCWSLRNARDAYELLNFTAQPHKNEILAALRYENVMTEGELSTALMEWQVRYPVARLCYLTTCDLRQASFAEERICRMLEKVSTKI